MATKLVMPYMSARMEKGVLVRWRKKEGDTIEQGDVIADVESDRASMALKSFIEGVLLQQLVPEGAEVAVGGPIAIIGEVGEALATAERMKPRYEAQEGDTRPQTLVPVPGGSREIIAPSLLGCDLTRLGEEVRALEAAGADWFHLDVMDGRFVPNISFGLPLVKAVRKVSNIPLDVHLMIEDPQNYVEAFADAGADLITVHYEACTHLHRCLQMIRKCRRRVGISLNPHTRIEALEHVIGDVDLVLIMTVNPGFGGQSYIDVCTEKIRRLHAYCERLGVKVDISVDGGIKETNIAVPAAAGANVFVSGSGILKSLDYSATIHSMRKQVQAQRAVYLAG